MTAAPISLQDLQRRLYVTAKADFGWKRWSTAWLYAVPEPRLKALPADRSHNP